MSRRNLPLLMACHFFISFLPHAPVAVLHFADITGSFALAMAVFSAERTAALCLEIPTGVLSDLAGRRGTLLLGACARIAGYAVFALSSSMSWLLAGAVLAGLSLALFSGNNHALLYDSLKDDDREAEYPMWYGRMNAMLQIGLGLSALVGGLLSIHSLRLAFVASAILQGLTLLPASLLREPHSHSDRIRPNILTFLRGAGRTFRRNRTLKTYAVGHLASDGVSSALFVYAPAFFALLWPTWAVGVVRMIANALSAISFWLAGDMLRRFNPLHALIGGHVFARAFNMIAFGFPTPFSPLAASATSLFYGVRNVAEHTLLQRQFTDAERATLGSMTAFGGGLLFAAVATCLGAVADVLGPAKALFLGELLFLPVIGLYVREYLRQTEA
jgi:MFS family permease